MKRESMKNKVNFSIFLFVIIGASFILTEGCKKDMDVDNNSNLLNIPTVPVPAGTFIMGSPTTELGRWNDEIQHQVTLSAFRMSKYEITNAQFADFLNAKSIGNDGIYAAAASPGQPLIYASSGAQDWGLHYADNRWVAVAGYDNHPVIDVSWEGASEFATYVGGRLPTEAQWEYACRAGTTTSFNTGECLVNAQANYNWTYPRSDCTNTTSTFPGTTQAVGSYPANAFGLYDMHGNVWEWCSDWHGDYPATAQTNPEGPASSEVRVARGGGSEDDANRCRSADRRGGPGWHQGRIIGFRVVLVP